MDHINSYDSFFEKKTNEDGYITLDFDDGQSIEVFPFETEEGEVLYEVSLSGSDLSIYDVAKLCNCKVVLAHIKSGTIWGDDIEIIKNTPQAIETLYEVSSYGACWRCRSIYTVFSTVEEIKMYYLNYSRIKLSEIKLILPENLPFNSSQYINKIGDIIEHKITNEWGEASLCNGHYDSNFQYVPAKKIKLSELKTYRNEKLYDLLIMLDDLESEFEFEREEILSAKYFLIGTSDIKNKKENLVLRPLSSNCLSVYDEFSNGETSHKCFLAMSPQ